MKSNDQLIASKLFLSDKYQVLIDKWKKAGETLVFTNGCFDILHPGHIDYLAKAANLGTKFIVGLNSDDSVRRLGKGSSRPIQSENDRGTILSALFFVDMVVRFNEDTPFELIYKIQPDVLVKGGDYDPEETNSSSKKYIVGSDIVRKKGGKVTVIPFVEGYSTTSIEKKIISGNHLKNPTNRHP